jgi:hypothetical protein
MVSGSDDRNFALMAEWQLYPGFYVFWVLIRIFTSWFCFVKPEADVQGVC